MCVHCCHQGVIIGSLSGMFVATWITLGALQLDRKYPTLPPTDVSQCPASAADNTSLWQQSSVDADWTTSAPPTTRVPDTTYVTTQVSNYTAR